MAGADGLRPRRLLQLRPPRQRRPTERRPHPPRVAGPARGRPHRFGPRRQPLVRRRAAGARAGARPPGIGDGPGGAQLRPGARIAARVQRQHVGLLPAADGRRAHAAGRDRHGARETARAHRRRQLAVLGPGALGDAAQAVRRATPPRRIGARRRRPPATEGAAASGAGLSDGSAPNSAAVPA